MTRTQRWALAGLAVPALSLASTGLDVARAVSSAWSISDVGIALAVGWIAHLPLFLPALLVGLWRPERLAGLVLATPIVAQAAVWWRFDVWLNQGTRSAVVLVGWVVLAVAVGVGGWFASRWLERREVPIGAALLGVVGAIYAASDTAAGRAPTATGPDIVLVTLDTVRRDRLPMYGNTRVEAPALAALAERGAVLDDLVATAPQTGPSHLTILTGQDPLTTGIFANGTPIGDQPGALARVLREQGWYTAAFVSGFPVHDRFGFGQGFDVFDAEFASLRGLHGLTPIRVLDALVVGNVPRERRGDAVADAALRWLEHAPRPFFLWVHYYDPHAPYTPPAPFHERYAPGPPTDGPPLDLPAWWPADQRAISDPAYLEAQYDAEVAWTDSLVGRVLERIDPGAIVAVVADHGESLTEHALFDHGDDLYDTALRVPGIVAGPGIQAGSRVACQVSTNQIAATLLALASVADEHPRDGASLAPVLAGEAACEGGEAFASTVGARHADPPVDHAIRTPGVKLIAREEADDEAYDLRVDPGEQGTAVVERDVVRALAERLELRRRRGVEPVHGARGWSREMLEKLGYAEPDR